MPRSGPRTCVWMAAVVLVLAGCAGTRGAAPPRIAAVPPPAPAKPAPPAVIGWEQTGRASWYGEPHHGRKTSSGEIYDMNALTAAHRTLPIGTRVRVTNLANGRSVEVRINDRGPFVGGRILDLSQAAARRLGPLGAGVFRVRLTVLAVADSPGRDTGASETGRRISP